MKAKESITGNTIMEITKVITNQSTNRNTNRSINSNTNRSTNRSTNLNTSRNTSRNIKKKSIRVTNQNTSPLTKPLQVTVVQVTILTKKFRCISRRLTELLHTTPYSGIRNVYTSICRHTCWINQYTLLEKEKKWKPLSLQDLDYLEILSTI